MTLGEPRDSCHPVAWLGTLAGRLEHGAPQVSRTGRLVYGIALTAAIVGTATLAGFGLCKAMRSKACPLRLGTYAVALKLSFSLRALACRAACAAQELERGELAQARTSLRSLVSRPTANLHRGQVASAAIESVAENFSDSLVAPLLYYCLYGLPGAFGYRAANTLDAMIGYHGPYEELGKAAARVDDVLNLVPARVSAVFLVLAAWLAYGNRKPAWEVLLGARDRTESPNAGWPMSAAAGALQVRLEKPGHYVLGEQFAYPGPLEVRRAVRLYYTAALLACLAAATYCRIR